MTEIEFINAQRNFRREISWMSTASFMVWLAAFFAIGAGFRYWFHEHETVSNVFIAFAVIGFVGAVVLISRHLREKHRLICRSCGQWLFSETSVSETGKCAKCQAEIFHLV
ncbi:MAG: hypothetical protein EXS35_03930 [Pedosphaera sp.]|nr:hypothetical protein [Pedosphaera sp.]